MKRIVTYVLLTGASATLFSCGSHETAKQPAAAKVQVTDSGRTVQFPPDSTTLHFFGTEKIGSTSMSAQLNAPARVAATVVHSSENPSQNLVLFENPELTANYTSLLQHIISIREKGSIIQQKKSIATQKQIEVDRFTDLANHGAGTGKDVSDAKTDLIGAQTDIAIAQNDLANEKTAVIEHETRLKLAGFNPESLIHASADKVWVICDIPESQVNNIKTSSTCQLHFTSYPNQTFTGTIESVGEVVDNITRMVKLRIGLPNLNNQLRAGMFASVSFGVSEGNNLSVPKSALITVQGKNYVFVKTNATTFTRKEVLSGTQINDRVIIYGGVQAGDEVVTDGTMQLKGISFGY
ncbi:RND family efflux transporter, MFP subunit [Filimonas lacunae]|uniref:RND family efflux transporter, MFP subunit n=1 Tax=Filimonas lacunae TaxID=477680 RepID=A0A173MDP0_9BACT|nr:efflux RND transporter periplasmic adaptor subunit [Filimonas lacunae]BAV05637.1 Co/Zn/Cd efflux system membrane fusion protein [Filimonas lacunae]SIT29103.1 RND family efflux transporter, MFP subunit [Filimonas lacunae]